MHLAYINSRAKTADVNFVNNEQTRRKLTNQRTSLMKKGVLSIIGGLTILATPIQNSSAIVISNPAKAEVEVQKKAEILKRWEKEATPEQKKELEELNSKELNSTPILFVTMTFLGLGTIALTARAIIGAKIRRKEELEKEDNQWREDTEEDQEITEKPEITII